MHDHATITVKRARMHNTGASDPTPDPASSATPYVLSSILDSPLGTTLTASLRVPPRQDRSVQSIDRMLIAIHDMLLRVSSGDSLTISVVAKEAGMTPQAAYRYFHDIDDVIELAIRCRQIADYHHLMISITAQGFENTVDLGNEIVAQLIAMSQRWSSLPTRMKTVMIRSHHATFHESTWRMSQLIMNSMRQRGDPCASIGVIRLCASLNAGMAVATSMLLLDENPASMPTIRPILIGIFTGALNQPG